MDGNGRLFRHLARQLLSNIQGYNTACHRYYRYSICLFPCVDTIVSIAV
jgi:hypothetical protein